MSFCSSPPGTSQTVSSKSVESCKIWPLWSRLPFLSPSLFPLFTLLQPQGPPWAQNKNLPRPTRVCTLQPLTPSHPNHLCLIGLFEQYGLLCLSQTSTPEVCISPFSVLKVLFPIVPWPIPSLQSPPFFTDTLLPEHLPPKFLPLFCFSS